MSTYIELQTDAFARNLENLQESANFDFAGVRRPFRGIEIKDDTYAIIKVIRSNGKEIPLTDSGSRVTPQSNSRQANSIDNPPIGGTFNYSNFIAQRVTDARQEKQQIVETFGEPFIFFYGERPRVLNVQGVLMNTTDFNWKNEFWHNYERYLRGTKLVELGARMYFYYDDQIVEGYMLDAQASHDSTLPYHVPFQFTIFVTAHTYLGLIESTNMYPISANVQIPADNLRDTKSFDQVIRKLRQKADELRPNDLVSTIESVQFASELAAGGVTGKAAIMGAIIRGMSDYEAKVQGFLANIKTYFYGRRMIVPTGLAGAERLAGPALQANEATFLGESPRRELPLRSKISDNYDEYVDGQSTAFAQAIVQETIETIELSDSEYEKKLRLDLAAMGVDVSDPTPAQNWRTSFTNSLTKVAGKVDFAAGIAGGTIGALTSKVSQMKQMAGSLPGVSASSAATAKPVVPGVKP